MIVVGLFHGIDITPSLYGILMGLRMNHARNSSVCCKMLNAMPNIYVGAVIRRPSFQEIPDHLFPKSSLSCIFGMYGKSLESNDGIPSFRLEHGFWGGSSPNGNESSYLWIPYDLGGMNIQRLGVKTRASWSWHVLVNIQMFLIFSDLRVLMAKFLATQAPSPSGCWGKENVAYPSKST